MQWTGMVMTSSDGAVWRFDPGTLFLEFMLTGGPAELSAVLAGFDSLHEPADIRQWTAASRLAVDPDEMAAGAADVCAARDLRDALWRLTQRSMAAGQADPADLATLNAAAASPPLVPQINAGGDLAWALPTTASAVLSTVARDAIEVMTGPATGRLRVCAAEDCQLVFLDTSRPGGRRWCSMERCGNRHKIRALRSRRSTPEPLLQKGPK